MNQQHRRFGSRSGQTLIMITLVMVPLCGIIGLVSDIGYMHFIKMSAQTAAEAATRATIYDYHATTGGASPTCGVGNVVCSATPTACPATITTPTNSIQHGCMYAIQHGFSSTGKQSVTYTSGINSVPPTATGTSSASYWITFRVSQNVPQLFSAVLGNTSGMVTARSTGSITGAADCIYALNPTMSQSISVQGNAHLTSACGIYDNSSAADALYSQGSATISATEYDVVGGTSTASPLSPTANTGVAHITDPLAGLPVPMSATYTCNYYNYSAPNWSNPTLSPGVYCGGINIGNNTYTLSAGNYILVGGGLTTQSSNSIITGTGVMIYNTFGATTTHGTISYSPINLSATSTVTLKAPTSGTYAGILFFEDRSAPASSDNYGGGSTAVYEGVIYAKNAAITMSGNSSINSNYTMIVADSIILTGTAGINNNYAALPNGQSPLQQAVIVE